MDSDVGWGLDAEDSWPAAKAEMRRGLPSADVWNTLASCDPGNPAPKLQSHAGSVSQRDDLFDEGLWGKDWTAAGSSRLISGSQELLDEHASAAAAASGMFAGHDRATDLRLLAKVNLSK